MPPRRPTVIRSGFVLALTPLVAGALFLGGAADVAAYGPPRGAPHTLEGSADWYASGQPRGAPQLVGVSTDWSVSGQPRSAPQIVGSAADWSASGRPRGAPQPRVASAAAQADLVAVRAGAPASVASRFAGPVLEPYPVGESPGSDPTQQAPAPSSAATGSPAPPAADDLPGAALDPLRVRATLGPLLRGGALGSGRTPAAVIDVASGAVLYRVADRPSTPASTTKLVTAVSALEALGPDTVVQTRTAVLNPRAATPRVVLVGAGDPTLASTSRRIGGPGTSIVPASLRQLARATAAALGGDSPVRVGYDDTLFTGPALHPTWSRGFPAGGVVAPVSALQVDQGRRTPGGLTRVADPALAAATRFAAELERAGVPVNGRIRATPRRPDSTELAAVSSPTVGVLVERMLATSDNDIAESLARLAAGSAGFPASFAGVRQRAREVLDSLGPVAAADVVVDGSGLSRADLLSPSTLTTLLREHREGPLVSGLPVAAATGSLRLRFKDRTTERAAGLARLKTGTLTGVTALAGFVSRPDGRLLALAFVDASTSGGTVAARAALDRAVAALVSCACTGSAGE